MKNTSKTQDNIKKTPYNGKDKIVRWDEVQVRF